MAPTSIKVSARYGSHLPALLQAVLKTRGPILELGVGMFSTAALHALCVPAARRLVTIENNKHWHGWGAQYASANHEVICVRDWDEAPIEQPWDVALVDHSPDARRAIEIERLAPYACIIIAHDADTKYWHQYGYERAFARFKHRLLYDAVEPATMILSNHSLKDFWVPI